MDFISRLVQGQNSGEDSKKMSDPSFYELPEREKRKLIEQLRAPAVEGQVQPDVEGLERAEAIADNQARLDESAIKEAEVDSNAKFRELQDIEEKDNEAQMLTDLADSEMDGGRSEPQFDLNKLLGIEAPQKPEPMMSMETQAPMTPVGDTYSFIGKPQVDKGEELKKALAANKGNVLGLARLYADRIKGAGDAQSGQEFNNALLRAAIQAGSAIAGVKPDYSGVDKMKTPDYKGDAERSIAMGKQATKDEEEARFKATLKDPNSALGKLYKAFDLDADTAFRAGITPAQLLSIQSKEDLQKMKNEIDAQKKIDSLEKDKKKFTRDLRKELSSGELGKAQSFYLKGESAAKALEKFTKNPSAFKDYAMLMNTLKTLQGDNSVVREAEVRLGMQATSAINSALNSLQKVANGKALQPSQRKDMVDTIKELTEASKRTYIQRIRPVVNQAKTEKIPLNLILPQGIQASEFSDNELSETVTQPQGDKVRVTLPNGRRGTILRSKLSEFKKTILMQ